MNMHDRPGKAEQYSDAISDGSQRTIVGGVAFAGKRNRLGHLLWRVTHGGDRRALPELRAALKLSMRGYAGRNKWTPEQVEALDGVIPWAVNLYMNDACPACSGRKYLTIPGAPSLSADACQECGATGKRRPDQVAGISDPWVAQQIMEYLASEDRRMSDGVYRTVKSGE